MFMKRTDRARTCKTKIKFLILWRLVVLECLGNVRFDRKLYYVCDNKDYKCEKDETPMFASHASGHVRRWG